MTELVGPSAEYQASFLAALLEFQAEGRDLDLDTAQLGNQDAFTAYVQRLHDDARSDVPPRFPGWVPGTNLWAVVDGEYVGTLQIRHRLTEHLRLVGGHIGYQVRPSRRGEGHATRMLALSLPIARSLGIERALLTCDPTNTASRKVIETNGGVLDAATDLKLRYWIATA